MKSVIWMSRDLLEQIVDCNGEYVLTKAGTTKVTQLGQTVTEAKEKLKNIGRADIVTQLY
ncbi:hypothetical protein [Sporomusa malonica]|uniref:Uncharacterized protein n=1 Tax=Sporomusa malonica TaxID=112901 RepID=A0A1W2CAE4_9FIRM|nr:hypothetical protein [Sporomusa malonica]SMC82140.1 hypothetical protein SAMN04488500_1103 [Sporomusa malonica]